MATGTLETRSTSKEISLNLRIDPVLKAEFAATAQAEDKPASEVLRRLMREYVQQAKRAAYYAEAQRQCLLLVNSPEAREEEAEVMRWIDNVRAPLPEEPDDWYPTISGPMSGRDDSQ
jgi:hypothetical protein